MDLRKALANMGATETQLNSKTFALAERAVADDAVDGLDTADAYVGALMQQVDDARRSVDNAASRIVGTEKRLTTLVAQANEAMNDLGGKVDEVRIEDKNIRDAVNAYTLILARTKAVLGEEALTEAVTVQLLETASYGLWRSIMGPKDSNDRRYR